LDRAAPDPEGDLRVWYLTTGDAGTREQARGLATALAADAEERLVRVSRLWAMGPPALVGLEAPAVTAIKGRLEPPWPDVLVSCGRRSALVAMAIRRRNPAPMIAVHLQPPTYPKAFDLVVAMAHDRLQGANVMRVDTALHGVRPAVLAAAAAGGDSRFAGLPRPWTGVLLGGATRRRSFRYEDALRLADQLDALRARIGGSLLVTPSRRTPAMVVATLGARYLSDQTVRIWDGAPPNPYLPLLALSDRLVVTSDSVSMISEALATTAAVSIFRLSSSPRHERFVDNLMAKALVTSLEGEAPVSGRAAIDATPLAAESVRRLLLAAR
jgi:mitochondrial fission protein ELM1